MSSIIFTETQIVYYKLYFITIQIKIKEIKKHLLKRAKIVLRIEFVLMYAI